MKALVIVVSIALWFIAVAAAQLDAETTEIPLAPEGISSWTTGPHAVYYKGRTYFGYQNQRKVEINCWDHATGKIGTPFVVHTYARDDDHGTPSLFVVPAGEHAGKLVVLFAHHNDPLHCRRSTRAEDITDWEAPAIIDDGGCNYPKPFVRSDGSVWMSYRLSGTGHVYRTTVDGVTWSAPTTLISGGLVYAFLAAQGDTFHMGFGLYASDTKRFRDAYHVCSHDGGVAWNRSDGTSIVPPITAENATCVYDDSTGREWSRVLDIAIDGDGTPAMLFYHNMPNFRSGTREFLDMTVSQLRWDGSTWLREDILTPAPYHRANLDAGAVYACSGAQTPGDIDTVVVMEGQHGVYSGGDFGTIELPCRARAVLYRRTPNGWQRLEPVTSAPETWANSTKRELFETRPQWVRHAQGDFQLILSRVTHYRAYQDWTSSLVGIHISE